MTAITLRNLPPDLAEIIEAKARDEKRSLNQTVIQLLRKATGLAQVKEPDVTYHDLDHLAGSWTEEEAHEFDEFLKEQRRIDEEMWR